MSPPPANAIGASSAASFALAGRCLDVSTTRLRRGRPDPPSAGAPLAAAAPLALRLAVHEYLGLGLEAQLLAPRRLAGELDDAELGLEVLEVLLQRHEQRLGVLGGEDHARINLGLGQPGQSAGEV